MSDGEKRLCDLKDAIDHEAKMKAALDKAKTDLAAGARARLWGQGQQRSRAMCEVGQSNLFA
jgi:hypothetical protein